jgi:hypothetical protein
MENRSICLLGLFVGLSFNEVDACIVRETG